MPAPQPAITSPSVTQSNSMIAQDQMQSYAHTMNQNYQQQTATYGSPQQVIYFLWPNLKKSQYFFKFLAIG